MLSSRLSIADKKIQEKIKSFFGLSTLGENREVFSKRNSNRISTRIIESTADEDILSPLLVEKLPVFESYIHKEEQHFISEHHLNPVHEDDKENSKDSDGLDDRA